MISQEIRNKGIAETKFKLGLTNKAPSDWTYDERATYNKALAQWLLVNAPQTSKAEADFIKGVATGTPTPLADTSFDVGMFVSEFGKQAVSINDVLNPLSEGNRAGLASTAKYLIVGGIVVVAFIYLSPYLLPKIKQGVNSIK